MDNIRDEIAQLESRIQIGIPAQRKQRVQEILSLKKNLFHDLKKYVAKRRTADNAEEADAYYAEMHVWIVEFCQQHIVKIRERSRAELMQKQQRLQQAKSLLAKSVIQQFQSR